MDRRLRILVGLCVIGIGLLGVKKLPEHLKTVEFFQARQYQIEGSHYLTKEIILQHASFPSNTSVFDDFSDVELRLEEHAMILNATVESNWWSSGVILMTLEERVPIALIAPLLAPVDREGKVLPLDPGKHRLNLPLARVIGTSEQMTEEGQIKTMALELERLGFNNPFFADGLSEISIDQYGNAEATWDRDVVLRFRPPLMSQVLRAGLASLEDAKKRKPGDAGIVIDLRFQDQVVVSYGEGGGQ